ncbi:YezD family protein [Cohnella yongneupensis]|uniref:YezD family protein n=1 Tax=Cohnella yongneupensis TaxID=425006 RepID=A0ABW0QUT2_9BACL
MAKPVEVDDRWLSRIAEQVNGLEYGEVNIVVHDGRIVQIERKERRRYDDGTSSVQRTLHTEEKKPRKQG